MNKHKLLLIPMLILGITFYTSCSESGDSNGAPYDPTKPVTLSTFYPDSGGMATQMILEGENFGTDTAYIKVYFNDKKAAIIKSIGNRMHVLVPRILGDGDEDYECTVSIKVAGKEYNFDKKFYYRKQYTITTISGKPGTKGFQEGTLASATFGAVRCIGVDKWNNVFITEQSNDGSVPAVCSVLNEASNTVRYLFEVSKGDNLSVPSIVEDSLVYVPYDYEENYNVMDPSNMWVPQTRKILHPSGGGNDFKRIIWKSSFAFCKSDGMVYTRSYAGELIKFNPTTGAAQKVIINGDNITDTDAYLMFHPAHSEELYLAYSARHCIYRYNINTGEYKLYAGTIGKADWVDGTLLEAEFNNPRQIAFDADNNMYIADENNHCIRMINPISGIVSTPIGIPKKSGYVDGDPEIALLSSPRGVAVVNNEGNEEVRTVYISDQGNRCIRKLSLQ
jgi:hypothetical protein